jgi:hypothetical protein
MRERFLVGQSTFTVKVISKSGIEIIREPTRPVGISKVEAEGASQGISKGH